MLAAGLASVVQLNDTRDPRNIVVLLGIVDNAETVGPSKMQVDTAASYFRHDRDFDLVSIIQWESLTTQFGKTFGLTGELTIIYKIKYGLMSDRRVVNKDCWKIPLFSVISIPGVLVPPVWPRSSFRQASAHPIDLSEKSFYSAA